LVVLEEEQRLLLSTVDAGASKLLPDM
jgi:hypothetical protein